MGTQAAGPGSPPRGWLARRLLAAAVLSCCFLLTQAQDIPVTVNPPKPVEGQEVTLTPGGSPNIFSCNWFRGEDLPPNRIFVYLPSSEQENGPGYTGRETGGSNCSLHIRSLTLNDTGKYTVLKTASTGLSEKGSVQIQVLEPVSNVIITSHPDKPVENDLIVLNCSSAGSNVSYSWSKGDQKLASGGHIFLGYNSLTFNPIRRNDTGNYTCSGQNSFSNSSATYLLDVFYGPDEPVISPPRHDYAEGSPLTLSCRADSHPSAQYTWSFNNTELPKMNSQLSILSLSFDQAGNYTCNASNPETSFSSSTSWEIKVLEKLIPPTLQPAEFIAHEHMNITLTCTTSESANVYVSWFKDGQPIPAKLILSERNRTLTIPDFSQADEGIYICQAQNPANSAQSNPSKITLDSSSGPGLSPGQIAGIVIGCLLGVVLISAVLYFVLKSTTLGRMEQHSSNGNIPSAPGHNQGVTDTKPTAGEEDIQYTTLAFNTYSPPQPKPGATIPLESGTIYSVIKNK